jgi:hypothetical protein
MPTTVPKGHRCVKGGGAAHGTRCNTCLCREPPTSGMDEVIAEGVSRMDVSRADDEARARDIDVGQSVARSATSTDSVKSGFGEERMTRLELATSTLGRASRGARPPRIR